MEKKEIKIRVRIRGPFRRPEDYRTSSFKQHETEIPGVSMTAGLELKSARKEIVDIRFAPEHFTQESAEAWAWRNYNIIRIKEAALNEEPYPRDLEI